MAGYQRGGPNNETDIDNSITDDSTANLTKSVLAGEDSRGDYNNVGTIEGAGVNYLAVSNFDPHSQQTLDNILKELKKISMHLALQNDVII